VTDGSLPRALAEIRALHQCPVLFVYLHEAHAKDFWPLSPSAPLVHKDLPGRLTAASAFLERWPHFTEELQHTYVDDMSNELALNYGLWPERIILLKYGRAKWASDFEQYGADELLYAARCVYTDAANGAVQQ